MHAELEAATREFYDALNSVLAGDTGPMEALWSHADDVTYMSPFGELLTGWEATRASWQAQAEQRLAGEVHPEDLHYFGADALGVVVNLERGTIEMGGEPTPVDIRVTSTYRLEDGRWRMIGHHTDPLG